MSHKNFHNLIESDNPEYKKAVYQKIESKLHLSAKKAEKKPNIWHNIAFKRTVFATLAVLIVCLAVIIPLALKDKDKLDVRYCYMADCEKIKLDCNAMEYASQNGSSILFVDWYDVAEEVITTLYVNKADNEDIVYTDDPQPPVDNPPTDNKDGLGAGAIIGIVIAGVAVVGGGGFAIFWFVIRKRRR